jgi:hypothetical protein
MAAESWSAVHDGGSGAGSGPVEQWNGRGVGEGGLDRARRDPEDVADLLDREVDVVVQVDDLALAATEPGDPLLDGSLERVVVVAHHSFRDSFTHHEPRQ